MTTMTLKTTSTSLIGLVGLLAALGAPACSEDDDSDSTDGTGGGTTSTGGRATDTGGRTANSGGTTAGSGGDESASGGSTAGSGGDDSTSGSSAAGSGGEAGGGTVASADSWIVGGWLFQDPAYFGYLAVVDDLSKAGQIDLRNVHEFGGDIVYAVHEGVVFVGQEDLPTIERWSVNDAGELEKTGEISLQAFGVTTTLGGGRNVIQVLDAETAWYFDRENFQVIVFNPSTMRTDGDTISFDGLQQDNHDVGLGFITRVGDYLVMSAQYWELPDEYTASLTRVAFIHVEDHSVTYADDTRCGGVGFQATDAAGNLYLGPHHGHAAYAAAGLDPNTSPCLLRINVGETEFDPEYHVDLGEELGGDVVAGLEQGDDNHAYLYRYAGAPITADNVGAARFAEAWELYSVELGDEAATYTKVENYVPAPPVGGSFRLRVGTEDARYVIASAEDYLSGTYYQLVEPTKAEERLNFPGFPGTAHNY